jgi:hypothetical protein
VHRDSPYDISDGCKPCVVTAPWAKSRPESCRLAAAALRRATATLPEAPDHHPKAREVREEDGYLTAFPPGRGTRRLIERRGALAAKPRPRPRRGRRNLNRCGIDLPDVWHAAANGTHEVRFVRGHLKIHGTRNYVAHFSIHLRLHQSASRTAHTRIFSSTPFSACSPRSSNFTPAEVRARPRTMSETSTSPGAERLLIREAMLTAPP